MLTDQELEAVWRLSECVRAPVSASDLVHNDECLFSFENPFSSPGGLYVNLRTWKGLGERYVPIDLKLHQNEAVYLHLQYRREPRESDEKGEVTKLGIGVEGGFDEDKYSVEKKLSIVIFSQIFTPTSNKRIFQLSDPDLPEPILTAALAVASHTGAGEQQAIKSWEAMDERPESRFAKDLIQLPPSADKIATLANSSLWRCELTGATDNLWLNLSDGFIGGGRKNFDGSGGSNGAIDHFNLLKRENISYPLAVKLGTITPEGAADVYSYEEDQMVTDPHLQEHLAHWGIELGAQKKTEKTIAQLELELNKDFAFDKIVEAGTELEKASGPGLVGFKNLGNTCYMNAVIQLLFRVPAVAEKFAESNHLKTTEYLMPGESHPPARTLFELNKLGCCIREGSEEAVSLLSLRKQVCASHPEFSSSRQQDAVEFALHLLKEIGKTDRSIKSLFKFKLLDKLACEENDIVKFSERSELILPVQIFSEDLDNGGPKRSKPAHVDFEKCLERCLAPSKLEGFRNPITGAVSENTFKSFGFKTCPPFLLLAVNRYFFAKDTFEAEKLDCAVKMPLHLSIEKYRDETALPDPEPAKDVVDQLVNMGFSERLAKQAALGTNNNMELALQYCLDEQNQEEFEPETLAVLTGMGFSEKQALLALQATNGNAERAADWLFSRIDTLQEVKEQHMNDGPGNYELIGLVSHIGKSTAVGHYVAHIRKPDDPNLWVILNDAHVAISKAPPVDFGYIYLYRRLTS